MLSKIFDRGWIWAGRRTARAAGVRLVNPSRTHEEFQTLEAIALDSPTLSAAACHENKIEEKELQMKSPSPTTKVVASALVLMLSVLAGACSAESGQKESASTSESGIKVPDDVAQRGTLNIATYAGLPPLSYKDANGKIVGSDIDIATAVAKELGLQVQFTNVPFESVIPGLLANRFDLAITGMSDTEEREQQVDFVDYLRSFTSIVVPKGNPGNVTSMDSLCGQPVGAQTASSQYPMLQAQSKKCKAGGKDPIDITAYPGVDQVELALKTGRSHAEVRAFVLGVYQVAQSNGTLEIATDSNGDPVKVDDPAPVGIAFAKDDTELRDAVKMALQATIDDGTYAQILKKYNMQDTAIDQARLNEGASS
ncbi:MAG: ABC transporter substrate-binding protein [Nocardioides sp.]